MKLEFVAQPWEGGRNVEDFFVDATSVPGPGALRIAVAWAKRGGLLLLEPYFERIKDEGGTVELIVGVSAGGATREGLELALELANSVYVSHNPDGTTFHPKVYHYRTAEHERLLVGSQNLTSGGLLGNVEAGLELAEEITEVRAPLFVAVESWLDELVADSALTIKLDQSTLTELVDDPRYRVGTEKSSTSALGSGPSDSKGLFGKSTKVRRRALAKAVEPIIAADGSSELAGEARVLLHLWGKKLSPSDARHPTGVNTNVTGVLRLGRSIYPIDKNSYFVDKMFSSLPWADRGNRPGKATVVPFDVFVHGESRGPVNLLVDFDEARIAGQNNIPTVLHWGELASELDAVDYTGQWVVLRAFSDGAFELEIKDSLAPEDEPPSA